MKSLSPARHVKRSVIQKRIMQMIKVFPLILALAIIAGCSHVTIQYREERLNPPNMVDQLRVGTPNAVGLDSFVLQNMLDAVEADWHRDLNSILVTRKGLLVVEAYFNGEERDTLHDIRSAGKSFTSTLVGIALNQGALKSLDQTVLDFFPEYEPLESPDPRKDRITVRHLLEMRSGFNADDDKGYSPGQENRMLRSNDWIRFALNVPMSEEPGTVWRYAGMNTMLLGGVVRSATSTPLPEYLENVLLKPLGISEYFWKKSPKGRAVGQGFFYLRPRDMIKFGLLFLKKGKWNGQQIVPATWVSEATQLRTRLASDRYSGYGYQWWISSEKVGPRKLSFFFASGNGGQKIYIIPDADMVVVITSSAYNRQRGQVRSRRILRDILSSVLE